MKKLTAVLMSMMVLGTTFGQMAYQQANSDDLFDLMTMDPSYEADYLSTSTEESEAAMATDVTLSLDIMGYVVEDLKYAIELNHDSPVEIKLYTSDGRQLRTLQGYAWLQSGQQTFSTNIEKLGTGSYLLVVNTPDLTMAQRFNKI